MNTEIHVQLKPGDVGDLDSESRSSSALDNASPLSSKTVPSSFHYENGSHNTNDVMVDNTQTSVMYESNLAADAALDDVKQISDGNSSHSLPSAVTGFASLTGEELQNLKSLFLTVDSLEVAKVELQHTVSTLADKFHGLQKTFEESECLRRTLERQVDLLQIENDSMKKRLQQFASDHPTTDTKGVLTEGSDSAVKPVDVTAQLSNDLESTKGDVQKLGSDIISLNALTKDLNGKVVWLESEFQKFFRRHSLIVENLCPKEDKSAATMFLVFAKSVLGVEIDDGEIDSVHVINLHSGTGASPEKRPRPILVTFSCYGIRSRIFKAWLSYRSSQMQGPGALSGERGSGICIKEYLTDSQESIYNEALQIRDRHQIADCWTFKGKTYVRTLEGELKEFSKDQWLAKQNASSNGCSIM